MAPLLPYVLMYAGGILAALPAARDFILPFLLPLGLVATGGYFLFKTRKKEPWPWLAAALWVAFGAIAPSWSANHRPADHVLNHLREGAPAAVEGQVRETPQVLTDRVVYLVDLVRLQYPGESAAVSGRARITHYSDHPATDLSAGDRVRFESVRLKVPRNFKNPGRFDYRQFLESQGIAVIGSLSPPRTVEPLGRSDLPFLISLRERLRPQVHAILARGFSAEKAALLKAMILGEKQSLPEDLHEAFIRTGLAHLMAVSGLHIGFVAGGAYLVFWPLVFSGLLRFAPERAQAGHAGKITAFLCALPVLFYMLLAGAKVSAVRAGIMVLAFLIAILVNRTRNLFNAFLAAVFIILLWHPQAVLDASFQLSFSALAGILFAVHYLVRPAEDPVERMGEPTWVQRLLKGRIDPEDPAHPWLNGLRSFLAGCALVSIAATLATLPVVLFQFNRISLIGIFMNLILVPLASVLIPLAVLLVALGLVWAPLSALLTVPVDLLLEAFIFVPRYFAGWPLVAVKVPTPPAGWVIFYYLLTAGAILQLSRRLYLLTPERSSRERWTLNLGIPFCALCVIAGLVWPRGPAWGSENPLRVTLIDVGQGESVFIEFPNRKTLLLDGGGFYKNSLDVGKLVVAPFLLNRGIRTLDYLGATHSDNDHIRGLESILDWFPARHYLERPGSGADRRLQQLGEKARSRGAVPVRLQTGKPLQVGEVRLRLLHPGDAFIRENGTGRGRVGNDLSLVLRLEYHDFSLLLTGDIGGKAESYLVAHDAPLRSTFLKAPHHGSRFSNTLPFIRAVRPRAVLISSGHLNPMGHPHPDALKRYASAGIEILRTDQNGALTLTTDGFIHRIETHENL